MEQSPNSTSNNSLQHFLRTPLGVSILAAAIVIIALIALSFVASKSIPGDSLYTVKTGVVEKGIGLTHIQNKSKAQYQVVLLKKRLAEVKALSGQNEVTEEAQTTFNTVVQRQSNTLESAIAASIDSSFPKLEVLALLNDFAGIAGAIEAVAENDPKLLTIGDHAEDIRRTTVNTYKERATSFAQTEDVKTVLTYITTQLQEVKDVLSSGEISYGTSEDAETYLERVDPALQKNDLAKVVISLGEASRFIAIERYSGVTSTEPEPVKQTNTATTTATTTIEITASTSDITIPTIEL